MLASHNIASLTSVEEIEGKLCASMEYVQGNSVATMLARKEGFSIWDLQDIARQACQGLDHAPRAQSGALQPGAGEDHGAVGWHREAAGIWHVAVRRWRRRRRRDKRRRSCIT